MHPDLYSVTHLSFLEHECALGGHRPGAQITRGQAVAQHRLVDEERRAGRWRYKASVPEALFAGIKGHWRAEQVVIVIEDVERHVTKAAQVLRGAAGHQTGNPRWTESRKFGCGYGGQGGCGCGYGHRYGCNLIYNVTETRIVAVVAVCYGWHFP